MPHQISQLSQEIVQGLFNAPFADDPIERIAELGRQAFKSHTFILALEDTERSLQDEDDKFRLKRVAVSSINKELETKWNGKSFWLYKKFSNEPEPVEKTDLQRDGQGVTRSETARLYGYDAMLSCALKVKGRFLGTISHFAKAGGFTLEEKELLILFANQTSLVLDWLSLPTALDKTVHALKELAQSLTTHDSQSILELVVDKARDLFSIPFCVLWQEAEDGNGMTVAAASPNVDAEYYNLRLGIADHTPDRARHTSQPFYIPDLQQQEGELKHRDEMVNRGWVSMLSAPLIVGDRRIGLLDLFTKHVRRFTDWELDLLLTFANHAALAMEKAEMIKQKQAHRKDSEKLRKLAALMVDLTEKRKRQDLLDTLLYGSLEIIGDSQRGLHAAISLLDYSTGRRTILASTSDRKITEPATFAQGITGLALREKRTIIVDDVHEADEYLELWEDTKSEIAIPLIARNAEIRVGTEVKYAEKIIGVLNIESSELKGFTELDEERLEPLARQAAILLERLEYNEKAKKFRDLEMRLKPSKAPEEIIEIVANSIIETLGFEFVYISLVNRAKNEIAAKYLFGKCPNDIEAFKKQARHNLDSKDIQAWIVKNQTTEVPERNDPRFDKAIFDEFEHDQIVRVFMPIIENNQVVGTVETGYDRNLREHIYERDIELLANFVVYAAQALDSKNANRLEKITHEFSAPISGIRNNASYLQRRGESLPPERLQTKYQDILTDCEILLHQVNELEFILGGAPRPPKIETTLIYRDIVIKTINQLQPLVADKAGAEKKIEYNLPNLSVKLETDIAKVSAVVYNLLTNSIKYAQKAPGKFKILVESEDFPEYIRLKVKDWGIGIKPELGEKIFEEGYRTQEAIDTDVKGSGLGLAISRIYMTQLGGKLYLAKNPQPPEATEFHLLIPKKSRGDK